MGDVLRKEVEERRQEIIDKLIVLDVYKKNDRHLFELSLTELEKAYKDLEKNSLLTEIFVLLSGAEEKNKRTIGPIWMKNDDAT